MSSDQWDLLTHLFHQALELPFDERPAFLREACGPNHKLRNVLESLLQADEEAGAFMEGPSEINVQSSLLISPFAERHANGKDRDSDRGRGEHPDGKSNTGADNGKG